jgi:glutamyl-Q tRNA(Asp) synthetase
MSNAPRLRFAPSPNGLLHLGHAYSALFTWEIARILGGSALLRIEDIDRARCKPEFDAAAREDLAWLGLDWPEPVLRQSRRLDAYRMAAQRLREMDLLYPCFCTRKAVAERATATDPDGAPLYDGRCRHRSVTERAELLTSGVTYQWRIAIDAATQTAGPLTITHWNHSDGITTTAAEPLDWGDAVLVRKDTPTSYHLAVTVDDAAQEITDVTRGTDLYRATDLHVLLQALLGLPHPRYCHHRLIRDEADNKLAKSRGSTSLRALRAEGFTPQMVREQLGF